MFRIAWKVLDTGYTESGDWIENKKVLQSHIDAQKENKEVIHWIEEEK
tara:strand:- start:1165 stop:1308 length:144 start_codon:yes stop_codon:yes gene_type:complete